MTLNTMRIMFGHYAKWIMGFMFVAMVVTTFSWNGLGRGNTASAGAAQSTDDVVAKVDGQPVTRGEVAQAIQGIQMQFGGGSVPLMQMPFVRAYALQQVEQSEEMLAKAKQMGITASDAEIQEQRDKILRADHARQALGLSDNASLADIDTALQQQGKSVETLFPDALVSQAVILQKLQDRINKTAVASEQDTRDSYTQYHTQHILIDNHKRSDVQAQNQAKQIIAKATAPGADFGALAKQYSEDPGTKNKGGDDGWIDVNTPYVTEFKKAAFALKPGQVTTDPVPSSSFGYFIIKLDGTRSKVPADFDKNKAKYISDYTTKKQQQAMQDFTQSVQQAPHDIVMIDPELKADQDFQNAQRIQPPDPAKQQALFRKAVGEYQQAIKNDPNNRDQAVMYVQIANADAQLKDLPGETAAYEAAVKANGAPDTQLLMALGDLYKQQGQNDKAVQAYQQASTADWNDAGTHQTLKTDFTALGKPDLADKEQAWIANYQKTHPQPKASPLSMGGSGAQPITITPSQGKTATVKTAAGKPASGHAAPTQ